MRWVEWSGSGGTAFFRRAVLHFSRYNSRVQNCPNIFGGGWTRSRSPRELRVRARPAFPPSPKGAGASLTLPASHPARPQRVRVPTIWCERLSIDRWRIDKVLGRCPNSAAVPYNPFPNRVRCVSATLGLGRAGVRGRIGWLLEPSWQRKVKCSARRFLLFPFEYLPSYEKA